MAQSAWRIAYGENVVPDGPDRCGMDVKEEIRHRVWSSFEEKGAVRFPGARGRIPNFSGAEKCVEFLCKSPWWKRAKTVKINPDLPQRPIRRRALEDGKVLLMAVPRLRTRKPFIKLDPAALTVSPLEASSIKGAARYGVPVSVEELPAIDLIVCGSVAVNLKGARVGKGGGYSDLEFGLLTRAKKIHSRVPIVSSVHELQIIDDDIPMNSHDIPLNAVITPDGMIELDSVYPRPRGIEWNLLPEEKLNSIPVLFEQRP